MSMVLQLLIIVLLQSMARSSNSVRCGFVSPKQDSMSPDTRDKLKQEEGLGIALTGPVISMFISGDNTSMEAERLSCESKGGLIKSTPHVFHSIGRGHAGEISIG